MINNLINKYSNIISKNCFKNKKDSLFFIEDRDKKITIFNNKEEAKSQFFTVTNKKNKQITFLKVDNCIFLDKDGKRCDSILFDDKEFLFIELKRINKSSTSKSMKTAIKQELLQNS